MRHVTNAEIIASLVDTSEDDVREMLEGRAPAILLVDAVELNAALELTRRATVASCVNFIRALASVSVGYPVSDERVVFRNAADMLEKS